MIEAALAVLFVAIVAALRPLHQMRRDRRERGLRGARLGFNPAKAPFSMRYRWFAHHYGGGLKAALLAPLAAAGVPILAGLNYPIAAKSVWAGGTPREWCTVDALVGVATNLKAGVAVIKGANDGVIIAAGADATNVIGFLGERNWTNPGWDPTTAPAVNDNVPIVLIGQGALISAQNGAALAMGDLVGVDALGQVKAIDTTKPLSCVGRVQLKDSDGSATVARAILGGAS